MLKQSIVIVALVLLVTSQSYAQKDDQLVYKLAQSLSGLPTTRAVKLEKAAYLGIVTTNVSLALQEQLKLKPGVGMVVERVEPDSPAEQAGIKQYDVLEKLDDQWLINPEQFVVLIRMHEPKDQIKLSLIRQGQPQMLTAQLTEKELPPLSAANPLLKSGTLTFRNGESFPGVMMLQPASGGKLELVMPGKSMSISTTDSNYSISIWRDDTGMHLKASDLAGNVVYDGPIDTDEQWKAVPPDVATRAHRLIDQMNAKVMFRQDKPAQPFAP